MKDNSEIGFEKELWASADKLRGSMDSSEYKHVILGLVFLKYIFDKFEERYKELLKTAKDSKRIKTLIRKVIFSLFQKSQDSNILAKMPDFQK